MTVRIEMTTEEDPAALRVIHEQLHEFNQAATGHRDGRLLSLLLRDSAGAVVGGLYGWSWGSTAYVQLLFVPQALRGQGHGTALMAGFEAEARRRGCSQTVLETHDFQAPDFYRSRGFAIIGEVADFPRGFRRFTLVKALPEG